MSNKLEQYVKGHKREFDTDSPSAELWGKIAAGLDEQKKKKQVKLRLWMGIAASFIIMMGVTFLYTYHREPAEVSIADINPGYAKKELRFASMIEDKKDSLQVYAKENPALYEQFSGDLSQLSQDYENLKKELQTSPTPGWIIRAMAKNLELQLQVINQQLSIINEVDQYKKENKI
ncbi:MAG: hypothetical protein EOO92_00985 [Pedobacter sp.]|nr:MAG: hypothetical protein EOO92_00985 [Pedobacter sp.]